MKENDSNFELSVSAMYHYIQKRTAIEKIDGHKGVDIFTCTSKGTNYNSSVLEPTSMVGNIPAHEEHTKILQRRIHIGRATRLFSKASDRASERLLDNVLPKFVN